MIARCTLSEMRQRFTDMVPSGRATTPDEAGAAFPPAQDAAPPDGVELF